MESDVHAGEAAELYALGALDEREQAGLEAHIAHCAQCLRRVGEAEETLLALERGSKAVDVPRRRRQRSADRSVPQGFRVVDPGGDRGRLRSRMAGPAFRSATRRRNARDDRQPLFTRAVQRQSAGQGHLRARSLVVLRHRFGKPAVRRLWASWEQSTRLGTTAARGATSELFVRGQPRFERVELRDGTALVESASIR